METPVVLVHGLAGSTPWWRETEAALAARHIVHLVDLPGYGAERRAAFELADAPDGLAERIMPLGRRVLAADAARAGPRTLLRTSRALLRVDVVAELAAIRAPTLLVWGERDPLIPATATSRFADAIPAAQIELIAEARHVPMVERPQEFARLLSEFLG